MRSMSSSPPGEVRIIGGQWKRTRLAVPERPGLRPTPGRVRETLFNWLGQDMTGWRVLDAFAGTGALGLEAASRGALEVTQLEQDPQLVQALRQHATRLRAAQVHVERADALAWMRGTTRRFDLVLLDPPFAAGLFDAALAAAVPCLAPHGWVSLECDQAQFTPPPGMSPRRHTRAGAVHVHLFQADA
jgi:16S rRNA (guanine966-N2)-methyltransferase